MQRTPARPAGGPSGPALTEVVFFDVGGTILRVCPSVGHVYAGAAARQGYQVDPEAINRSFQAAWTKSLARRRAADYVSGDEVLRQEWRLIVAECFNGLLPASAVERAFEALFEHFSGPEPWSVAEGATETFRALREEGFSLGILSNWDRRLPVTLEKLGLIGFFEHLVVSYREGVEKPHRKIFEAAARRAGASPEGTVMVGDSWEQDIAPALSMGWRAIWLGREGPPPSRDEHPPFFRAAGFPEVLRTIQSFRRPGV